MIYPTVQKANATKLMGGNLPCQSEGSIQPLYPIKNIWARVRMCNWLLIYTRAFADLESCTLFNIEDGPTGGKIFNKDTIAIIPKSIIKLLLL